MNASIIRNAPATGKEAFDTFLMPSSIGIVIRERQIYKGHSIIHPCSNNERFEGQNNSSK